MMKNDHDETHVNEFKTQFAQKYYSVVAANPERKPTSLEAMPHKMR